MHGGLSHFKATLQRRNERINTTNSKFTQKSSTKNRESNLNFPKPSVN